MKRILILLFILLNTLHAQKLLVNMDLQQSDHLKAYGAAYFALEKGINVEWLLNYRGGSFLMDHYPALERELLLRGVSYESVGGSAAARIYNEIKNENMDIVLLEKAPKIAIYAPPNKQAWDDAVLLALDYAEIPYETLWDQQVLQGKLETFDWLHLHHEDFTGQFGKFYANYRHTDWYRDQVQKNKSMAQSLGFATVWQLKHAVVQAFKDYINRGGFLFAMCSATDTMDIALAAQGVDIVDAPFDGDPPNPAAQQKLDYSNTLAFKNFQLVTNPLVYEYSDIDVPPSNNPVLRGAEAEYFTLFEFSAKYDPVPTMLTQCHVNAVEGFMGQTTGFNKDLIKESIVIMGQAEGTKQAKYIHGNLGKGTFTFYGGHDPEDYQHFINDPPTQLSLHKKSPGYRLILNNILFPAARKKKLKT
ncbi:MAG: asparagine synthetase B [candidate division KSB1 bacterium]|nr:asparagine synthetase B [candidate division KSB1 bacterium]